MVLDKSKEAAKKQTTEILNSLFAKYQLTLADTFEHKHYRLITRTGMEKIMAGSGITVSYSVVFANENCVIIKGKFHSPKTDQHIVTFASASNKTSTSDYYAEMAEKRCMARGVLKLEGLYALNVYSDDEFDTKTMSEREASEFRTNRSKIYGNTATPGRQAQYKGS